MPRQRALLEKIRNLMASSRHRLAPESRKQRIIETNLKHSFEGPRVPNLPRVSPNKTWAESEQDQRTDSAYCVFGRPRTNKASCGLGDYPKYFRTIFTPTSVADQRSPLNFTALKRSKLAKCSPSLSGGKPFSRCPG